MNSTDERYMRMALDEAMKGWGRTNPNPLVGAVIVKNGKVVGKGFHERAGMPHAEVMALREAKDSAVGATMYVTLEPCNHYGRTPPCSEAIIRAGIRRVVIAVRDPNPVAMGGAERLREAGIEVEIGLLEEEASYINEPFLVSAYNRRPYVMVKSALSLDGFLATLEGDSGQGRGGMSGKFAHDFVHKWRARLDAILIGAGTVLKDNPKLSARGMGNVIQPAKIVLDAKLETPPDAALFDSSDAKVLIFAAAQYEDNSKIRKLLQAGAEVVLLDADEDGNIDPNQVLFNLWERQIYSLMIEGGSWVIGSFLSAGLADRLALIYTPYVFGRGIPFARISNPPLHLEDAIRMKHMKVLHEGDDVIVWAKPA